MQVGQPIIYVGRGVFYTTPFIRLLDCEVLVLPQRVEALYFLRGEVWGNGPGERG